MDGIATDGEPRKERFSLDLLGRTHPDRDATVDIAVCFTDKSSSLGLQHAVNIAVSAAVSATSPPSSIGRSRGQARLVPWRLQSFARHQRSLLPHDATTTPMLSDDAVRHR